MGLIVFLLAGSPATEAETLPLFNPLARPHVPGTALRASPQAVPERARKSVLLTEVDGPVVFRRQGVSGARRAASRTPLGPGDSLRTGRGGRALIALPGAGTIALEGNTAWTLREYKPRSGRLFFSAHLAFGTLKARVKKLPRGSRYEIRTPVAVASVRGTAFILSAYSHGGTLYSRLAVAEGLVSFQSPAGEECLVAPRQSATALETGVVTPPQGDGVRTCRLLASILRRKRISSRYQRHDFENGLPIAINALGGRNDTDAITKAEEHAPGTTPAVSLGSEPGMPIRPSPVAPPVFFSQSADDSVATETAPNSAQDRRNDTA